MFGRSSSGPASGWTGQSNITRSAWFDGSADYLIKSAPTAGTATEFILGCWIRRTAFTSYQALFVGSNSGSNQFQVLLFNDDRLEVNDQTAGYNMRLTTSRKLRDSEWLHIVVSVYTSDATADDRVRIWINGEEETAFDNRTNPSSGHSTWWNTTDDRYVGYAATAYFYDGLMTQAFCLDGVSIQQGDYAITDFGESVTVGTNGSVWAPIKDSTIVGHANTVGGQSFVLSSDIGDGTDDSSNAINFTPTSMTDAANGSDDVPSNPLPVLSTIYKIGSTSGSSTVENGGVINNGSAAAYNELLLSMPIPSTGKWYFEVKYVATGSYGVGIRDLSQNWTQQIFQPSNCAGLFDNGAGTRGTQLANVNSNSHAALNANDILQVAFDADTGNLWLGTNDTWLGSGSPEPDTDTSPTYTLTTGTDTYFGLLIGAGSGTDLQLMRESEWTHTVPTGYKELRLTNLSAPDYQGIDSFNALLYTGDATNDRAITGAGFQADLGWLKKRSAALSHKVVDSSRGVGNIIYPDVTNAEAAETWLDSFDADGFTIDNVNNANDNTATYIKYLWKMNGGTTAANNDGSISSTVQVHPDGLWSIVQYTGTGANGTVGHGLSSAPVFLIIKPTSIANPWTVWINGMDGDTFQYLYTNLADQTGATVFNSTVPGASTFSLGSSNNTNQSSQSFVAYCFAQTTGLLAAGRYVGNGNANGPVVLAGFRPRFVLIKGNAAQEWCIYDTVREAYNDGSSLYLHPDTSGAEGTDFKDVDILANAFKIRDSTATLNTSGTHYHYLAIADVAGGVGLPPIPGR